jgi:hypothetical protein
LTGGSYGMGSQQGPAPYRAPTQYGKGPKGYARSDERLREDICERLTRDHDIDASDVSIDVKGGNVTLSGTVDDRQLKHYVEDTVERCFGVRDIDNRLTVRSRQQSGSGSLGGSSDTSYAGQSAATGTTGSRASTGTASGTPASPGGTTGDDGGSARSRN